MHQNALHIFFALRPKHWIKNLFVLAPLVFSKSFLDPHKMLLAISGFVTFCALSSAGYLLNDLADLERDRHHGHKASRPISSGKVSIRAAALTAGLLGLAGLGYALWLDGRFFCVAAAYLANIVLYSLWLKTFVILDVIVIAAGFLLRLFAGAILIHVAVSQWMWVSALFLALFLGFAKRRGELGMLVDNSKMHREVLGQYNIQLLDQFLTITGGCALMAYALYTASDYVVEKFGTRNLIFTLPFVVYGICRYFYLVHQKRCHGNPTDILYSDPPTIINLLLWVLIVFIIVTG
jgi:4-hydroxybenzoate polyprenyltransferase